MKAVLKLKKNFFLLLCPAFWLGGNGHFVVRSFIRKYGKFVALLATPSFFFITLLQHS
jgi:hypothetical protein